MTFFSQSQLPPPLRLTTDRLSSVLCKFSCKKFYTFIRVSPLNGVTGTVHPHTPPPGDATSASTALSYARHVSNLNFIQFPLLSYNTKWQSHIH